MAETESNETPPGPDPAPTTRQSNPARIKPWFRQPLLVYITMVAAFAVCAVIVIHYVIVAQRTGHP